MSDFRNEPADSEPEDIERVETEETTDEAVIGSNDTQDPRESAEP